VRRKNEKNYDYRKMRYNSSQPAKWRIYQAKLQRTSKLKGYLKNLPYLVAMSGGVLTVLAIFFLASNWIYITWSRSAQEPPPPEKNLDTPQQMLARADLALFLPSAAGNSSTLTDQFSHERDGVVYTIKTTIDTKLQKYIVRLLKRSRTLQSAVVVLNPYDGRVYAMVGRDTEGNGDNLSLKADYPAASLFKIVTAAAALERAGFTPDKTLFFKGRKHTLYKYQLDTSKGRYSRKTTFRKAFASSNNSVFGKVGIYDLGQNVLAEYAHKFQFNRRIAFDLPLAESTINVPPDNFGLAEISSGFNKKTLISPLHATLLAAVAANRGKMPTPWLVNSVQDNTGKVLYQAERSALNSPVHSKTATGLKILMQDAVRYGTSRKAFRSLRRKKVFKKIELGAKTGTINDKEDQFKYDWITAYALDPDGISGICIGILGVHGKVLGVRSTELARAIINYYFSL
jgi:membrane carboxypeptidase/penicillin-binding protein